MINVESVSKCYGKFEAVKNLSFSVGREQVLGFLGPNGAGKTTIMKMLTGFHFPSSGQVKIDGISVQENPVEIKKRIGYLPENNPLYGDLTPAEYLSFMAAARLIPDDKKQKALNNAIRACGLEEVKNQKIESLSKGYKQRVGLAQAIIHDPEILILDEPTSGLDPNQIIEIRSLIRELGKSKTVILSTHILQEVEAVCSAVLILSEGCIAAQGTPEEIALSMKGRPGDTWDLLLKGTPAIAGASVRENLTQHFASLGRELGEVSLENANPYAGSGIVRLRFNIHPNGSGGNNSGGSTDYSADGELVFDWVLSQGYKIIGMNREKLSLEDIFVKLTNEGKSE